MNRISRLAVIPMACSIMMFASGGAAIAQSPNPHAISMYNLGLNAYKQGSPESAIIFFRRAADIDPNLADAQYNLGVLYQSQRRYKESVPRFLEVLRVKPNDADARYQLGLTYMGLGQYPEAKRELMTIAPNNPHFAEAQRKTQECDQKIGQGVTTPTIPPPVEAPLSTPTTGADPNAAGQQPLATNPPAFGTQPPVDTQQVAPQVTQQVVQQPQQEVQQPAQQQPYSQPPSAVAPPEVKLTPILPNTQLRVIATGFYAPSGLTFDKAGNLYVANFNSNTVDRISRDGTRTHFASGGHLKGPIGLVADSEGNIYVANYSGGTIARITPAGISTLIAAGFKKPYILTLDADGNLFVSQQEDNSIIRITLPQTLTSTKPSTTP